MKKTIYLIIVFVLGLVYMLGRIAVGRTTSNSDRGFNIPIYYERPQLGETYSWLEDCKYGKVKWEVIFDSSKSGYMKRDSSSCLFQDSLRFTYTYTPKRAIFVTAIKPPSCSSTVECGLNEIEGRWFTQFHVSPSSPSRRVIER